MGVKLTLKDGSKFTFDMENSLDKLERAVNRKKFIKLDKMIIQTSEIKYIEVV